jgi:hypothetical protein
MKIGKYGCGMTPLQVELSDFRKEATVPLFLSKIQA